MWHRIGMVLAVLPLAAMVRGSWIATGSAGAVQIDSTSRTCGAAVIEWTPFANQDPNPAPAVT